MLVAFAEVEDALAAGRELNTQVKHQGDAARAAERTLELALVRYRNGASTYLDVVVAQTAALDAARKALELRTEQFSIAVATVKALEGVAGP